MTPIGTFNQRMSIAVGAARCMVHSVYNAASEYYKLHRKLDVIEVTTLYKIRSWNIYPGAYIFMNFLRWNRQCRGGFHCGFWKLFVENNNLFVPKILIILLHSIYRSIQTTSSDGIFKIKRMSLREILNTKSRTFQIILSYPIHRVYLETNSAVNASTYGTGSRSAIGKRSGTTVAHYKLPLIHATMLGTNCLATSMKLPLSNIGPTE